MPILSVDSDACRQWQPVEQDGGATAAQQPGLPAGGARLRGRAQAHGLDLLAEFGKEEGWKHPSLAMVGLVAVQVHTRMLRLPDVLLSSQPTISRTFDAESLDVF